MSENNFEQTAEQVAAFQRIWMESISKGMQAAFTFTPGAPPSELMTQIRSGIFRALAESWEEFMRSPQFLEGMRQSMEQAVAFRKMSNDFMGKVRNEMQSPSREDVDTILVTVRHIEKRLLDRVSDLSAQVTAIKEQFDAQTPNRPAPRAAAARVKTPRRKATSQRQAQG